MHTVVHVFVVVGTSSLILLVLDFGNERPELQYVVTTRNWVVSDLCSVQP